VNSTYQSYPVPLDSCIASYLKGTSLKVILLAGGLGTRLSEETELKPKPMVLIGDKPILQHIMEIYASQGYTDFVIAGGYKQEIISNWLNSSQLELSRGWSVTLVDTGLDSTTGQRIKKILDLYREDRYFMTYGDGLANVNLRELILSHESAGALVTLTSVRPPARFGFLRLSGNSIVGFEEKNQLDSGWINGGFFVIEGRVGDVIADWTSPFEYGALSNLAASGNLGAHFHEGFWKPMDTLREKRELEQLLGNGVPPWLAG
jgi:glucose-1-phosphate cytidylyltransferase